MTEGHAEALAQLREVEAHGGGRLVIGEVTTPTELDGASSVSISIDCEEFERSADGLGASIATALPFGLGQLCDSWPRLVIDVVEDASRNCFDELLPNGTRARLRRAIQKAVSQGCSELRREEQARTRR
jgi:hypothetical protein